MFELLKSAYQVLGKLNVKWCFCGGWAIDLFLKEETRAHKDLDIMVFKEDLGETISYLQDQGWRLEAPTRKGFLPVTVENCNEFDYDNIWCMNEAYPLDYLKVDEQGNCNFYQYEREVQEEVDYLEILLNTRENGEFVYRRNPAVRLSLDRAFYSYEGLPYLAPEIVLLYKSKYLSEDNQSDYNQVIGKLSGDQKDWLREALIMEYGSDHPWVENL